MSRCLSDDALARAHAELASAAERAHLATCARCAGRSRKQARDLALITGVLRDTRELRVRPVSPRRRWRPAAVGLAVAAAALLLWVEIAVWRAVTPVPPTMQPHEVAAILADVSASLFSVSGDPATAVPLAAPEEQPPVSLEALAQELDIRLSGGEPR